MGLSATKLIAEMRIEDIQVLRFAPDDQGSNSSYGRTASRVTHGAKAELLSGPGCGCIDEADGGSDIEINIHVPGGEPITVAVAGRVTVDSSPRLRSALLDLLHRGGGPGLIVDMSAVSYLDMSGIATLLETLKAAREHSATLSLTGMSGDVRALAEILQLDKIFRAWGSEVEFR